MSKVAIVTDSTSTIPADLLTGLAVRIAPQVVIFGEETLRDGVDIKPTDFYARLASSRILPTTSQVAVNDFKQIFEELHSEGYEILCMLVSQKLSNTINAATQAAEMVPDAKIEIIDTKGASMAMGFPVIHVAKAAAQGADLAACKALAEKAREHAWIAIAPETLEFLHRGGCIGGGARFLGTLLNMRPVLELVDGRLEPIERIRTRKKMLNRMLELTKERINGRTPVSIAVVHANSSDDAAFLRQLLINEIKPDVIITTEVSPSIGTHTGPGTIGVAFFAGLE